CRRRLRLRRIGSPSSSVCCGDDQRRVRVLSYDHSNASAARVSNVDVVTFAVRIVSVVLPGHLFPLGLGDASKVHLVAGMRRIADHSASPTGSPSIQTSPPSPTSFFPTRPHSFHPAPGGVQ